jgi:hypothetical protein
MEPVMRVVQGRLPLEVRERLIGVLGHKPVREAG